MNKLFSLIKERGLGYVIKHLFKKIIKYKIPGYPSVKTHFAGKSGLEIGGPSGIFKNHGLIPLYNVAQNIDGCNFSNSTLWEGNITNGETYNYIDGKKGVQYISEATDLSFIPDSKYDFIISSNCLEHVANPMKAIKEWSRVIKKDGLILLILPNKNYCFDHNRPTTKFSHLLDDFNNNTDEDDLTHLDEILALHDLNMDKRAGTLEQFRERSLNNPNYRALHHHVFDISLLEEIFNYFKIDVLLTHTNEEYIILGRKQ